MDWSALAVWGDVARRHASVIPTKSAFMDARGAVTFGEVNARINRLSAALRARGLRSGDRVAILARNRSEYFEVLGTAKHGLIAVPLNWRLSARELGHVLSDCRPAAIVADEQFVPVIDELRGGLGANVPCIVFGAAQPGWIAYEDLIGAASAEEVAANVAPDDVACLMYSSGTTGLPKGAKLTHRGILGNAQMQSDVALGLSDDDRLLDVLPFFHVGGMWYYAFAGYARGCSAVILPEFEPRVVLETLSREAITTLHLVPTMIDVLLRELPHVEADLTRLRRLLYAASPIPLDLLKRAMAALPRTGFVQSYGSTESGAATYLHCADHAEAITNSRLEPRLRSCGRTAQETEVAVQALGGGHAAPREIGEVLVRSRRMMQGYWNNDKLIAAAFDQGWLRMGDLGYFDEDGYLYLVDRKNDMIVSGGENVYPSEVESHMLDDPAIAEAAVFGIADPKWVEMVAAAVVLKPGIKATGEEIVTRLRQRVASYKCPKKIIIVDKLPRNAAGKILRKTLRTDYGPGPN
jgi:acyl-CoA synthetase (AMP-forming)/AMP-acid ligase II